MMWDPIKWFVYRGSWRPLAALYKNSPPNPGAGYSRDRGHSQFSFSLRCLHSLLSAQSHQVAHTAASHMTHARPCLEGLHTVCQSGVKWGIKVPSVCMRAGDGIYSSGCMHAYAQHFVMVLLPLTSPLKRCFCPLSLILFQLQHARQMSLLKCVCISVKLKILYLDIRACITLSFPYQLCSLAHCSKTLTTAYCNRHMVCFHTPKSL